MNTKNKQNGFIFNYYRIEAALRVDFRLAPEEGIWPSYVRERYINLKIINLIYLYSTP